ncbi:methyl-accepting chemotaxis protein [Methylophaga sp.]|uniref:methyl-accepting chemotaxis protein n=1 Tax=Methylophaga sp. TaxID=2024840 RepID=UPI00271F6AFB|nr:methyl-accepting chemotaxis protein [Methylophaga sp.]MDO8826664.1 methyl-accepting chemotaxis protein [Methylophaga sp.]
MHLSIQQRFSIWAGLSLLTIVVVTALISVWQFGSIKQNLSEQSREVTQQQAQNYLQLLAQDTAAQLRIPLEKALHTAQANAAVMQAVVADSTIADKRALALSILERTLMLNNDFLGVYVAFEPNALDSSDFLYRDSLGSDSRGRFQPYVVRSGSNAFLVENLEGLEDHTLDENGVRAGEYYLCSKDSKSSCVIDPYLYPVDGEQVLLTTLVAPVMDNGRFIGNTGIDISAAFLQSVIKDVAAQLYQGLGQTLLVSPRGVIVGHSQQPELIGQNLSALENDLREALLAVSMAGQTQILQQQGQFVVLSPFNMPGHEQGWVTYLAVPEAEVLAAVAQQEQFLGHAQTTFITTTSLLGLILALIGVGVVWLVARSSIKPLSDMTTLVASIAEGEGDLTQKIEIQRQDETGKLSALLNIFIGKLHKLIQQLIPLGENVSTLSAEGREISEQTRLQMDQQQQLLEEMVSAVTEMAASAQQIAGNADRTSQFVSTANESSQSGAGLVRRTSESIHVVSNSVRESQTAMLELEKNSEAIVSILSVIQGIAEQTNLLALNAAIEAARAGEQGRGFAVVADEVRALASRTQVATVDIQDKLSILQKGSRQAAAAMQLSGEQVTETVDLARAAESALKDIQQAILEVTEMTFQIASATEEQSAVCEDVSKNLTKISQLVEHTTEGARHLNQVGTQLDEAANSLKRQLGSFKV